MSNDLLLDAWWVNQNSTLAEWDNVTQTVTADKLINVTDISFTKGQDLSIGENHTFWTNDMPNATMAIQTQSDIKINSTNWWKNITIHWYKPDAVTEESANWITNTTWNTTIDDSVVLYQENIMVYISDVKYNITPTTCQADCNTNTPTWEEKVVSGQKYWTCMQDVNGDVNGVCEFFRVIVEKNKE